ncbi:MAG TPA: SdrD B-like domain-containing protein [Ignavibacteriales bacterium]|nr:SdrD B-like domain-containing protein [Ignavibacteriales bacterium]
MKRLYLFAMVLLVCIFAISGLTQAQGGGSHMPGGSGGGNHTPGGSGGSGECEDSTGGSGGSGGCEDSTGGDDEAKIIGGNIWHDINGNGIQDAGELPITTGVTATLVPCTGSEDLASTTVGPDGSYFIRFKGKYLNKYGYEQFKIKFTLTNGMSFTTPEVGNNSGSSDDTDSDVDQITGITNNCYTFATSQMSVDAGLYFKATMQGKVWDDLNNDGTGDTGILNLEVQLVERDTKETIICITNAEGNYSFSNIAPGSYSLQFVIPAGYTVTALPYPAGGHFQGKTKCFDIFSGDILTSKDAILYKPIVYAPISGHVWNDLNCNGAQDAGEPSVTSGVTATLLKHGLADILDTKTLDGAGNYSFDYSSAYGDGNNEYDVKFTLTNGMSFTAPEAVSDETKDSDVNPSTEMAGPVQFTAEGTHLDAGLFSNASLQGVVWEDLSNDGTLNTGIPGEPIKEGIIVKLFRCNTTQEAAVCTTGTDGSYSFSNIIPGSYYLQYEVPEGYNVTALPYAADGVTPGKTICFDVTSGVVLSSKNAGLFMPPSNGAVSGYVWLDVNGNGTENGPEPVKDNVTVQLYLLNTSTSTYGLMGTTVTAGGGLYEFTELSAGTYKVLFIPPADFTFTKYLPSDVRGQGQSDADNDPSNLGWTISFEVDPENPSLIRADYVDAGLIPSTGASGRIGDFVWKDLDANGIQNGLEPGAPNVAVDLYWFNGTAFVLLESTTTGSDGKYVFLNLIAGEYFVLFNAPAGYKFTERIGAITAARNSDADPLTGKTVSITLDPVKLSNITFVDAGLIPSNAGSIGDLVWNDKDCDGIQDLNETGVQYMEVKLYSFAQGHSDFIRSTMTDQYGRYAFTNLEAGKYRIQFELPVDFERFTVMNVEDNHFDEKDSDADQNGWTGPIIISEGEHENDVDAGLCKAPVRNASLGDLIWNDSNRNGIQDGGETGIEGVEVKLHACTSDHSNPNDTCQCGNVIATTRTDKAGKYIFSNIMPGYYCVEIVVPCHYTVTKSDQTDDWKDSDVIPSMKHTGCIKLNPGETNNTVDAGLYPTPPATIGDLVWIDANKNGIQDNGEKGLCNVQVELYMCGVNKPVAAAKTEMDGKYTFKNLIPNTTYAVKFYLPKGYTFSPLDEGNNDNYDSDVCAKECSGMTRYYDILPDEVNMTIDCGMYLATTTACNYVWKDNNNNGLKDEGEQGIQGVTVELYQCSNSTLIQSVKTDAAGLFTFTGILLDSYYLKVVIPDGYTISTSSQQGGQEGVDIDLGTNGQSSCFEVADTTKSIGKPIALVHKPTTDVAYRSGTPAEFSLLQNYPNPFNPSTTIEFAVPQAGQYSLKIYNMLGQEVITLIERELPVGYHTAVFDASRMPSGIYIYKLTGTNITLTRKMMLSK